MAMVEENPIVDELILKSCMETIGDELGLKAESNWFLSIFDPKSDLRLLRSDLGSKQEPRNQVSLFC